MGSQPSLQTLCGRPWASVMRQRVRQGLPRKPRGVADQCSGSDQRLKPRYWISAVMSQPREPQLHSPHGAIHQVGTGAESGAVAAGREGISNDWVWRVERLVTVFPLISREVAGASCEAPAPVGGVYVISQGDACVSTRCVV